MKIYCVFSLILIFLYLELTINFDFRADVKRLTAKLRIKVFYIPLPLVNGYVKKTENEIGFFIKIGKLREKRIKDQQKNRNLSNSSTLVKYAIYLIDVKRLNLVLRLSRFDDSFRTALLYRAFYLAQAYVKMLLYSTDTVINGVLEFSDADAQVVVDGAIALSLKSVLYKLIKICMKKIKARLPRKMQERRLGGKI